MNNVRIVRNAHTHSMYRASNRKYTSNFIVHTFCPTQKSCEQEVFCEFFSVFVSENLFGWMTMVGGWRNANTICVRCQVARCNSIVVIFCFFCCTNCTRMYLYMYLYIFCPWQCNMVVPHRLHVFLAGSGFFGFIITQQSQSKNVRHRIRHTLNTQPSPRRPPKRCNALAYENGFASKSCTFIRSHSLCVYLQILLLLFHQCYCCSIPFSQGMLYCCLWGGGGSPLVVASKIFLRSL